VWLTHPRSQPGDPFPQGWAAGKTKPTVTLHLNPGQALLYFKDFPVFSCNVTARKYRNFVLKAQTNFELKFVRDFRDLGTRPGKRPPSSQLIRSLPYPLPFLCFHRLIHTRISTFFLILSGAQSGIQVHDAFPKSGILVQ
jgi:hypothetical protein